MGSEGSENLREYGTWTDLYIFTIYVPQKNLI